MGFTFGVIRWLTRIFGRQTFEILGDDGTIEEKTIIDLSEVHDAQSMIDMAKGASNLDSEKSIAYRLRIDQDPIVQEYHKQIEATNIALADRACGKVDASGQPLTPTEGLQRFMDMSYQAYTNEALKRVKRGGPKGERI